MGTLSRSEIQEIHEKHIITLLEYHRKTPLELTQFRVILALLNHCRKIKKWFGWLKIPIEFLVEEAKTDSAEELNNAIYSLDELGLIQISATGTQFKLSLIKEN